MKKKIFLGIDTSNYMSSVCFIDENRNILHERRQLLSVKEGKRGLQQSEAVFQHIKNIPELLDNNINLSEYEIAAIGVSKAPRSQEGSYMPVFMTGISLAESIGRIFNLPIFYTTHQEGHIAAGYYSTPNRPTKDDFLVVHISGGTSEILYVKLKETGYTIEMIGGTLDIHAGQLIDRMGVLMGLQFPAGKYLELIAKESPEDFDRIPTSVKGLSFHFSGAEAEGIRRFNRGEPQSLLARAIEHNIAATIEKALKRSIEAGFPKEILVVGGVAQNQYIREHLQQRLQHPRIGAQLYYAEKNYSGDNAFGVANITLNNFLLNF